MINPLKGNKAYRITSVYGMRNLAGTTAMHYGIDIVCQDGTQGCELVATVDGTITDVRKTIPDSHTGLGITTSVVGNYVYITTADGYQVMYRHLRYNSIPANIVKGAKVKVGDVIGRMGRTGQATPTADHLHYEMRDNKGVAFDPKPYLNTTKEFKTVSKTNANNSGKLVPAANPNTAAPTLSAGNKVKVLAAINYDTGGTFKTYYSVYDVIQVKGNRIVIGIGNVITAAVDVKNLAKA